MLDSTSSLLLMLALTINVNKRVSMGVTIKEVAKEAGVSLMTVSRVVNNKGNIAKSTRENVLQAIKKLNYKLKIIHLMSKFKIIQRENQIKMASLSQNPQIIKH